MTNNPEVASTMYGLKVLSVGDVIVTQVLNEKLELYDHVDSNNLIKLQSNNILTTVVNSNEEIQINTYKITEKLQTSSVLYKVQHDNEQLILKLIFESDDILPEEPLRLLFKNNNANIVPLRKVIQINNNNTNWYFMVIPYYEEGTLKSTKYGFTLNCVINVGLQLCATLEHVHSKMKLIHQDVKLDNIAITNTEFIENNSQYNNNKLLINNVSIILIDFDVAKSISCYEDFSRYGHSTPSYYCPTENTIIQNNNRNTIISYTKNEIYALGYVLFRMLFGPVHNRDSIIVSNSLTNYTEYNEQLNNNLNLHFEKLNINGNIKQRLKKLFKKLFNFYPAHRPDYKEIRNDLENIYEPIEELIHFSKLQIPINQRLNRYFDPTITIEHLCELYNLDINFVKEEFITEFCETNQPVNELTKEGVFLDGNNFLNDTCILIIAKIKNVTLTLDKNETRILLDIDKYKLRKLGYKMSSFDLNLGQLLRNIGEKLKQEKEGKTQTELIQYIARLFIEYPQLLDIFYDISSIVDIFKTFLPTKNGNENLTILKLLFPPENSDLMNNSFVDPKKLLKHHNQQNFSSVFNLFKKIIICLPNSNESPLELEISKFASISEIIDMCKKHFHEEKLIVLIDSEGGNSICEIGELKQDVIYYIE